MNNYLWWRDGIIYQIYPRSFADQNNDGLGDLPGITSRLDYLADLGVDAIWLSPFYPTPDKDFGYDISDYVNVDARFGTLADFDHLVREAHKRNIRIVLDLVLNHTSDQHPWFLESRSSRDNPRRDWYIWKSASNGKVPNNWQACFGDKAWEYDATTGEYYLHLFTKEQPDLNWRNPEVRKAILDSVRFWLERGADGFRLDVFNAYFKHPDLPSNPTKPGLRAFDRQHHIYDMDQPEMMPLLNELRALLDAYPERYSVGETYMATPQKTVSYCGPDKLHAAFSFDFTSVGMGMRFPWSAEWVMQQIERREEVFTAAGIWPTTVMGNHDQPRTASRYGKGEDDTQARLAMALLLTLRGTPFLYYGEEIGMRDTPLRRDEIQDPPGKKYWPFYKGRDLCRTPMQWDASPNAGFSTPKPWLPVHPDYTKRNVTAQRNDPASIFNLTRKLIALRREHAALRQGDFVRVPAPQGVAAYVRGTGTGSVLVALNFGKRTCKLVPPAGKWTVLFQDKPSASPFDLAPGSINLFIC